MDDFGKITKTDFSDINLDDIRNEFSDWIYQCCIILGKSIIEPLTFNDFVDEYMEWYFNNDKQYITYIIHKSLIHIETLLNNKSMIFNDDQYQTKFVSFGLSTVKYIYYDIHILV